MRRRLCGAPIIGLTLGPLYTIVPTGRQCFNPLPWWRWALGLRCRYCELRECG